MAHRCYISNPPHLPPCPPKVLDHTYNGGRLKRIVDDGKDKNMTYNEKIGSWLMNIPEFTPVDVSIGELSELAPSFSKEDRKEGSSSRRPPETVLSRLRGDASGGLNSLKGRDEGEEIFRLQGASYLELYRPKLAQTPTCEPVSSGKNQSERESSKARCPRYKNVMQKSSCRSNILTSSPTDTTVSICPNQQQTVEDKYTHSGICRNKNAFGDTSWWSPGAKVRTPPPSQCQVDHSKKKNCEKSRRSLPSRKGASSRQNPPRWR